MPGPEPAPAPELRDYLRIFRRRKSAVILSFVVVVGAAVLGSVLQTPVYASAAEVLLQPRSTESLFDPNTGMANNPERTVDTEIRIVGSQPVKNAVQAKLGESPKVAVAALGQTDVIQIRATSTIPKRAADIANAYADAYTEFRRKQAVDDVLAAAQQVQGKIADLQKQVDPLPPGPQKDALVAQQALFKQKLDELQVAGALKTGGAQVVTTAVPSTAPVSPRPVRSGVLGGVVGLLLGAGLALLIDYLDDSVKTKEDFARAAPGVPVLGLIPAVSGWKPTEGPRVISLEDPRSAAAEAYRTLRTSIQFLGLERPMGIVHVTSAKAQEGKTTTLANLGVALALAGQRVIVVCCDLRRPRIHEFFGLTNDVGFTSVLLGKVPLTAALQPVPGQQRLSILASGPLPPNPSELLSSRRAVEVFASLKAEADIVLVDSPPVLPVTDALVLSGRVDATLLVLVAGATTRKDTGQAVEALQQVDAPLVGAVLNGVTAQDGYGYDYGYYHRYEQSRVRVSKNGKASPEREPAKQQ